MPLFRLVRSLFLANLGFLIVSSASDLEQGSIEGAKFAIASPPAAVNWNRNILLIAHGYRPETAPLVADLVPSQFAYHTLLNEGWIIAKTSYRRNGIVVADAIRDLDNLRDHIVQTHGPPLHVIIKGDSMGGTIATLIAERGGDDYHGAIAIGAALDLRENDEASGVSTNPQLPLLFLSNRSEFDGPQSYVSTVLGSSSAPITTPVSFHVDRDGHVNVNQAERLLAIRAMSRWIAEGRESLPSPPPAAPYIDATRPPQPSASQVTVLSLIHI